MSLKLKFSFGFCLLGLLFILASLPTTYAQGNCAIPKSGPWPACATGGNASSANSPNSCTIPETGPWPPCATWKGAATSEPSESPQAPELPADCRIPASGPWPPCASGEPASLPADNCIIPKTGPWPACDLLTVTVNNFWADQYHVAWRGATENVHLVVMFETITIDERSGEEERTSNEITYSLDGLAGARFVALKPFHGRLFEAQFITFQLQNTTEKVLAQRVMPLVKPRKVATVHQFENIGTAANQTVSWNVSPALDGSRVQVHVVRPPKTPEILNAPLGSEQREELTNMPLIGEMGVASEVDRVELIVNGWIVDTYR